MLDYRTDCRVSDRAWYKIIKNIGPGFLCESTFSQHKYPPVIGGDI
jgi:hypothetical protein